MGLREAAIGNVLSEIQEAWEAVVFALCYRALYVSSNGSVYWSDKTSRCDCDETEYFGRQRRYWHLDTFGTPGVNNGLNGYEQYEIVEADDATRGRLLEAVEESGGDYTISIDDQDWLFDRHGNATGRKGTWYRCTDVLPYGDANPDTTPKKFFGEALRTLGTIPIGFFDDEPLLE